MESFPDSYRTIGIVGDCIPRRQATRTDSAIRPADRRTPGCRIRAQRIARSDVPQTSRATPVTSVHNGNLSAGAYRKKTAAVLRAPGNRTPGWSQTSAIEMPRGRRNPRFLRSYAHAELPYNPCRSPEADANSLGERVSRRSFSHSIATPASRRASRYARIPHGPWHARTNVPPARR